MRCGCASNRSRAYISSSCNFCRERGDRRCWTAEHDDYLTIQICSSASDHIQRTHRRGSSSGSEYECSLASSDSTDCGGSRLRKARQVQAATYRTSGSGQRGGYPGTNLGHWVPIAIAEELPWPICANAQVREHDELCIVNCSTVGKRPRFNSSQRQGQNSRVSDHILLPNIPICIES